MASQDQVIEAVEKNHLWVNAFLLIHPTDETALQLGRAVIAMLKDRNCLLPRYVDDPALTAIAKLNPTLYLSVNAS